MEEQKWSILWKEDLINWKCSKEAFPILTTFSLLTWEKGEWKKNEDLQNSVAEVAFATVGNVVTAAYGVCWPEVG